MNMTNNTPKFNNKSNYVEYDKKSIDDILNEIGEIDVEEASSEILKWMANNVEEFIDNQKKIFKLDLTIDAEDGASETMPSIRKLQDLYRAMPNDPESADGSSIDNLDEAINSLSKKDLAFIDELQACREELDTVTSRVFDAMKANHELLRALFKRMIFYYELQGVSKGNLLLQELDGEVDINKFEYESFPVAVQVTEPKVEIHNPSDGSVTQKGGDVSYEYTIPEGFTIWLEIAFRPKQREISSLF